MKSYRVLRPFRSLSRPDLGTVRAGDAVALEPDHAEALGDLVEPVAAPPRGRHAVGDHAGGGWFPVTLGGREVEKVRGRAEAEQRAAELDAEAEAGG